MLRALAAGVQALEEVHVVAERGALGGGGVGGEAGQDCVEEFPGRAAEVGFERFVGEFGGYGGAGEGGGLVGGGGEGSFGIVLGGGVG